MKSPSTSGSLEWGVEGAGGRGTSPDMGRVIWATRRGSCGECAERFIYMEDEFICIQHKGRAVPNFWGAREC